MNKFFDSDNPVMKFLARLVDLAALNVITILYSLPIITLGGALAAMNNVLLHLVREDGTYVFSMFRTSFRKNFRQGIPEGLIVLAIAAVTAVDMWVLHGSEAKIATLMMIVITIVAAFIFLISIYMFALQSRYENTVKGTIINAIALAAGNLPKTILMAVTWLIWILVLVYLHKAAPLAILLYGFTLPGYICAILYDRIFAKLEDGEDDSEE
jgi:uncharacterized membrane protein YesL